MNPAFWRGKRVFLTGHTGFKGSWLALWLQGAGAEVHGYALSPPARPNLFDEAHVGDVLATHTLGNVCDAREIGQAMATAAPDVVLHLAAQSLVRQSYQAPVETYATNVMGTVNLLEAVRSCPSVKVVVNVTTDKCYDNREWAWGYRENEPLGGLDPYASSKACSELVTAAYRASFLAQAGVAVASARAGNVIGGGDWAVDRLVPDFFRAADAALPLSVRYAGATRPWQHVLEPLSGYLLLAEKLASGDANFAEAWNFGPTDDDAVSVRDLLDRLIRKLPDTRWQETSGATVHEAHYLKLDSSKARAQLGWRPRWNLDVALDKTIEWQKAWRAGQDMQQVCGAQIGAYEANA